MKKTPELQIDLTFYEKSDWQNLWEKLLTQCPIPNKHESVESQTLYAYNYANGMIEMLKEKQVEQKEQNDKSE